MALICLLIGKECTLLGSKGWQKKEQETGIEASTVKCNQRDHHDAMSKDAE